MNSQILYVKNGTNDFEQFKNKLLTPINGTYPAAIACQDKIGIEFLQHAISNAHYLFINIYQAEIIGFAAVNFGTDTNQHTYLYIDLICNAPSTKPQTQTQTQLPNQLVRMGAKDIIQQIESVAKQLNCNYIKLSAIDDVIPYYFRLGFNFQTVYDNNNQEINTYLQTKATNLINELRNAQKDQNLDEQEQKLIQIIQRFYPGYLKEKTQQQLATMQTNRTGPFREHGIPMIKVLKIPWSNLTPPEDMDVELGGSKHKRTIKKTTKKTNKKRTGTNKKTRTNKKKNGTNKKTTKKRKHISNKK